jgi:hypothetical protein
MTKFGYSASEWCSAKDEARAAMIERARARDTITYSDLTISISSIAFKPDDFAFASLLGEISTEEDEAGRGMLTALVIRKGDEMLPGAGFYNLAERLGRDTADWLQCWVTEINRVFDFWSTR